MGFFRPLGSGAEYVPWRDRLTVLDETCFWPGVCTGMPSLGARHSDWQKRPMVHVCLIDDGTDKQLGRVTMGWAQHNGRAMSACLGCWPADRGPWMNDSSVDRAVHLGADLSRPGRDDDGGEAKVSPGYTRGR